jgi:hypothetical protein
MIRREFTLFERRDIVTRAYASTGQIRSVAREYGIQPSQIRRWRKSLRDVNWESVSRNQLRGNAGRPPLMDNLEDELYDYVINSRDCGLSVTTGDLLRWLNGNLKL